MRGQLIQAESRLSITAAAADRWLPLRPGSELAFLAVVGRILLDSRLARNVAQLPAPILATFQAADVSLLAQCGLDARRVREVVEQLGESDAPLVVAGASIVQSNSLDALVASHYVNAMLGNIGKTGGVLPPAADAPAAAQHRPAEALAAADVVLIDGANPAYALPRSSGVFDALARAGTVVSFNRFLDDSGAWSDLLLPDHDPLESEMAVAPAVSHQRGVATSRPFVQPLYDTRPLERTLAELARRMALEYHAVTAKDVVEPLLTGEVTFEDAVRQGGVWLDTAGDGPVKISSQPIDFTAAVFDGDAGQYPMAFQPYLSLQFHDGQGSHLPWLQELPDPASSAIWGLPVEIDPQTAMRLRVSNGDIVRVESRHGTLDAPAYVHPGAVPGVASMAIGDGHSHFGRYASGRGANPLTILAPVWEKSTGALVLGGTRVRLSRVADRRDWIQFAAPDREERTFEHR